MTITRKEYREMRQRIKINKQSGSYVVTYPATGHPGYSKEKVFSPAIGFNAYAKARTFAMNKAMKLAIRPPAELKTMTLKITGISPLICHKGQLGAVSEGAVHGPGTNGRKQRNLSSNRPYSSSFPEKKIKKIV